MRISHSNSISNKADLSTPTSVQYINITVCILYIYCIYCMVCLDVVGVRRASVAVVVVDRGTEATDEQSWTQTVQPEWSMAY